MEVPQYEELHGTGTFSAPEASFSSQFMLLRNPYWMGALAVIENQALALRLLPSKPEVWQLSGALQDGRAIQSDSLLCGGPTEPPYNVGFSVLKSVSLGSSLEAPLLSSEFPLVNYFEGPASLRYRGWELAISSDASVQHAQSLVKQWKLPREGMTLQCTCPGAMVKEHLEIARSIMTLASLALGTGVSSHRHIFHWESTALETWQFMTGDELGPGLAIPSHNMDTFLTFALPAFESLTPERQALVRLAITYINLSEGRYLDNRLLAIVQAWEFLSAAWVEKQPLTEDLLCLRSRIIRLLKDWRQDHIGSDPHGFWGSRVVSALDWVRLNQQLQKFAAMWNVNLETLGVDLNLLRRVRDNVAHVGRLPEELSANPEKRYNLLRNARHALRLILLQLLDYRDLVVVNKNGWKATAAMDEALAGKYGAA